MTDKASYITLENNRIENSGDDGIAVVSYRNDGGLVNHITARNNVIVNNKWGRQMSVVGGGQVLYENNHLENNLAGAACLYIAQEASYSTYGAHDVMARYNTLKTCGGSRHGPRRGDGLQRRPGGQHQHHADPQRHRAETASPASASSAR